MKYTPTSKLYGYFPLLPTGFRIETLCELKCCTQVMIYFSFLCIIVTSAIKSEEKGIKQPYYDHKRNML